MAAPVQQGQTRLIFHHATSLQTFDHLEAEHSSLLDMNPSMNGWPTDVYDQQGSTSSLPVSQVFIQLKELHAKLQGFDPEWSEQNPFWSRVDGLSDVQLRELHVTWTQYVEYCKVLLYVPVPTRYASRQSRIFALTRPVENSDAIGERPGSNTDQGLNNNPVVQQSSESLACDGLDSGIHPISFPGMDNGGQAGTPRPLGSREDHELITRDQDVPTPPASLPLTSTQVEATGDNSTIR
jgi:hypothetical protein